MTASPRRAYREAALARGLCGVCRSRPRLGRSARCFRCGDANSKMKPERVDYEPIDAILDKPRIRLLRVMRHLDWSPMFDILDAFGLDSSDARAWNIGSQYVRRLVLAGEAERRGERGSCEYRITSKGRQALDDVLRGYERTLGVA